MASKSYTFIEDTDDDNGYDFWSGFFTTGERSATSVKNLVDQVMNDLHSHDCIKELTLIGHGAPGTISVGNGQGGTDPAKEINGRNENVWGPQLDRMRCRFCKDGVVFLRGCNVGAESAGAAKLFRIAQHLGCAVVQAPTGMCDPFSVGGLIQTVRPTDMAPPTALPLTESTKKKKSGGGAKVPLRTRGQALHWVDRRAIVAASYLPRVLGRPFRAALLERHGVAVPADVRRALVHCLALYQPRFAPAAGLSINGLLRFQLRAGATRRWSQPVAIMGDGAFVSLLGSNTSLLYSLDRAARRQVRRFIHETP